ncbi:MAG: hypothetical protein AAF748_10020 [Pseudomonadota bacterium]
MDMRWISTLALGLALAATPVVADPALEALGPCLQVHESVEQYAQAFEEMGWEPANQQDSARAVQAVAELEVATRNLELAFEDSAAVSAFVEDATRFTERLTALPVSVLTKGDVLLVISSFLVANRGEVSCHLVGDTLDAVADTVPNEPGAIGSSTLAFSYAEIEPQAESAFTDLRVNAVRLFIPPEAKHLAAAADGVMLRGSWIIEE